MRWAVVSWLLLALSACGRLGFSSEDGGHGPGSDDGDGGDGDGDDAVVTACTPTEIVVPGTPLVYRIVRITDGWAIVGSVDGTGTDVFLDIVDDNNNVTVARKMLFTASSSGDIAFLGDRLAIASSTSGIGHIDFYGLDGTNVAPQVTLGSSPPQLDAHDGVVEAVTAVSGLVVKTLAPDGTTVRDVRTLVASGVSSSGAIVHDPAGISALWFGSPPNPPAHLTAIADSGAVRLADRAYSTMASGGGSMAWTGTQIVMQWDTSTLVPQIVMLDGSLAELAPPSTFLGLARGTGKVAWDGEAIGYIRASTTAGVVIFATADTSGQRTSNDVNFGQSSAGAAGPMIAAGPRRFGFVWGRGNPVTELRFAVVCR